MNNNIIKLPKTNCFVCRKDIDIDNEIYYVFIEKDKTQGNMEYCTQCYLTDIKNMAELDPFLIHIYHKNFIRMNK